MSRSTLPTHIFSPPKFLSKFLFSTTCRLSRRSFQQKSVRSWLKSRLEPYNCNVVIVGLEELFRFHVGIPLQPAKPPHLDGCRRAECWSDWISKYNQCEMIGVVVDVGDGATHVHTLYQLLMVMLLAVASNQFLLLGRMSLSLFSSFYGKEESMYRLKTLLK